MINFKYYLPLPYEIYFHGTKKAESSQNTEL